LHLDAKTLDTERTFDCIFSNKVLFHLPRQELRESFARQHEVLNNKGLLLHSLWHGNGEDEYSGLRLFYYTEQDIADLLGESWDILKIGRHAKMAVDDSVYVLARKKN
jgi:predicted SAM-dependent methyltransferase